MGLCLYRQGKREIAFILQKTVIETKDHTDDGDRKGSGNQKAQKQGQDHKQRVVFQVQSCHQRHNKHQGDHHPVDREQHLGQRLKVIFHQFS